MTLYATKLSVLAFLIFSSKVFANWTNVLCVKAYDDQHYVLKNGDGTKETIYGEWKLIERNTKGILTFEVTEDDYLAVASQCNNGYLPQPKHENGEFYIFKIIKNDGTFGLAKGKYTGTKLPYRCYLSPTSCFK
ncbi:hypothetical protein [Zooshikella sp. RANM57]|uniref:hypothetical protein n=1 Tax=Zooshikella sp. RANM57 TaxID=3425863 RepID=UPI003D702359